MTPAADKQSTVGNGTRITLGVTLVIFGLFISGIAGAVSASFAAGGDRGRIQEQILQLQTENRQQNDDLRHMTNTLMEMRESLVRIETMLQSQSRLPSLRTPAPGGFSSPPAAARSGP